MTTQGFVIGVFSCANVLISPSSPRDWYHNMIPISPASSSNELKEEETMGEDSDSGGDKELCEAAERKQI